MTALCTDLVSSEVGEAPLSAAGARHPSPPRRRLRLKQYSVLPGFGVSLGYTLLYLGLVVVLPLVALAAKTVHLTWREFIDTITNPRVVASYELSFGASFVAAVVNLVLGLLLSWVLVRYQFPGRRIMDALVDLPFALPTAVAGIALTTVYSPNGWIGRHLTPLGIRVTERRLGIVIALIFIGLPFVVRTVQPVLQEIGGEVEEAAASLGASRLYIFRRVLLPELFPALLTGFALAFARAVGEYGSVVFIAGNMPMKTEISPLLIITKLEEYNYAGATAIALIMLLASLFLLLLINGLQGWLTRRAG